MDPEPLRSAAFPKRFRLKRRKLIGMLFAEKRTRTLEPPKSDPLRRRGSVSNGVVRIVYGLVDRASSGVTAPYQAGFTVPRRISRAVDRNRVKRLLRAAFQQQKPHFDALAIPDDEVLVFMMIFRSNMRDGEPVALRDAVGALTRLRAEVSSRTADILNPVGNE